MAPPLAVARALRARQDVVNAQDGLLDPSFILGPLIVSNAVAWLLWGMITFHLALFIREIRRRRERRSRNASNSEMSNAWRFNYDWFGAGRRRKAAADKMRSEDINPWTMSFAAPSINAYPATHTRQPSLPSRRHARHQSTKSAYSASKDPYSPTSAGDQDSHSMLLPSPESTSHDSTLASSLLAIILTSAVYIIICVRTVLNTAAFWRLAIAGWGSASISIQSRWAGVTVADVFAPVVFLLAAVYYIHSLYFSQAPSRHRQHTLRPLSLLNHRMSGTNNVEYAESPTSTAPSASLPHPSRSSRVGSGTGWKVKALGAGSGSGFASSLTSAEMPISGWRLAEPALLAIAAAVVGICGIVDTIRTANIMPLRTPTPLDAPSLIWYAGMFAFDFVLCILLSKQLYNGRLWETSSWLALISQAMFEAGGAQLLVTFISMILIVVWRADKPSSTLPLVVPCILPSFYAFSALAHAARMSRMAYWCSSPSSGISYGPSVKDLEAKRNLRRTASRNSVIPKFELDEIEMGGVSSTAVPFDDHHGADNNNNVADLVSRTPRPRERLVDLAAATSALSSGSNTFSSDGTGASSGQGRGDEMVRHAMAVGAERERQRNEAEAKLTGMVLDRDTSGSGSGLQQQHSGAEAVRTGRASVMSGVSGGSAVTSLELPVFRKGRSRRSRYVNGNGFGYHGDYEWDEDSDEYQSDELTFLTSEEDGGAWDYGFSNNEKEKEREERAATLMAATHAGTVLSPIHGLSRLAGESEEEPSESGSNPRFFSAVGLGGRKASKHVTNLHPLASSTGQGGNDEEGEEADTLSVLSRTSKRSSRSRRRSRRSFYPPHPHAHHPLPLRRLLPTPPSHSPLEGPQLPSSTHPYQQHRLSPSRALASTRASSVDSLPPPMFAPGSPAGSVLVISRAARDLEPSIAEPSIYHAASVAATRASTGSAFSTFSYTYPRPVHLPDLDLDLAEGRGTYGRGGEGSLGLEGAMTGTGTDGTAVFGGGMGTNDGSPTSGPLSAGTGSVRSPLSPHPHPYASGADLPPEETRRRWNVHPLKRFAEMGRLKR